MTSIGGPQPRFWLALLIVTLLMAGCASPIPTSNPPSTAVPASPPEGPTLAPTPTVFPAATPTVATVVQTGLLTRQGSELLLDGEPFREISFDKFDLLHQLVVTEHGTWEHDLQHGVPAAEGALRSLQEHGFRVVRVNASPFYASWFDDVFFDADPVRQAQKRREFFAAFDQMLDACDRHGIRIVATLVWNVDNLGDLGGHSIRVGMTDQTSPGRRRVEEYIREVVKRYKDRTTIAMWELGNEWNLGADIQWSHFDYTSDELAAYYQQTATLIRSIDSRHLLTTGDSSPRPAAMHLRRAARAGQAVDWTFDTASELTDYLRLMNPDPIDVISIHYYDDAMISLGGTLGSPENLRFFANAAQEMGKPLFVGEIGLDANVSRYDTKAGLDLLRATLPVIVELKLPLTLYWAFADDRQLGEVDTSLRYGRTDEALALIKEAAAEIRP
jgi:endo-1,4-beta-mannosidase